MCPVWFSVSIGLSPYTSPSCIPPHPCLPAIPAWNFDLLISSLNVTRNPHQQALVPLLEDENKGLCCRIVNKKCTLAINTRLLHCNEKMIIKACTVMMATTQVVV
jgi:hypothetical protein